jgi:hypothetical protein
MLHLTQIPSLGQGGLVTGIAALLVLFAGVPTRPPRWLLAALAACVGLALLIQALLSIWYLSSPTYIDHIEASVASTTHYFMQGKPIYPPLDSFTFHGLLYGPLLPQLNSLGYRLAGGILGSKLVGWAAAWLALGVIAFTAPAQKRNRAWVIGLLSAGCVVTSFGSILTADRADSLLLLFAAVALWSVVRLPVRVSLMLAALLAGLAADLKLHGPAYILPAFAWLAGAWWRPARLPSLRPRTAVAATLVATVVVAAAAVIPFLPFNVDAQAYFSYLRLGAKHGLDPALLGWGCTFLLCLWIPPLFVVRALRPRPAPDLLRQLTLFAAVLLPAELVVTLIAAKPGAGIHHMLPFVGYHSFLLTQLLERTGSYDADQRWSERPTTQAAVVGVALVLFGTSWSTALGIRTSVNFELQRPLRQAQLAELLRFADQYPRGMLGIAGNESYALTLLRPWITLRGTSQTDYGAWMDWNLSGVSDRPLVTALGRCEIPYLFVPIGGEAFALDNTYRTGPLFSAEVRAAFAAHYRLIDPGQYFNVYRCGAGAGELVKRGSL